MLLPEFIYGTYREVSIGCGKIASKLEKGASWEEATESNMVNTEENEGLILMDGPSPEIQGKNYHVYSLFHKILSRILHSEESIEGIFQESIKTSWGTLALMSGRGIQTQDIFHFYPSRRIPFLRACLRHFDSYLQEGKRFLSAGLERRTIWEIPTNLHVVLAHLGVRTQELITPLPSGGLIELIKTHNIDIDSDVPDDRRRAE